MFVGDPFKDDLGCFLQPFSLLQKLDAIHRTSEAPKDSMTGAEGDKDKLQSVVGKVAREREQESQEREEQKNVQASVGSLKALEAFTLSYRVRWPVNLLTLISPPL